MDKIYFHNNLISYRMYSIRSKCPHDELAIKIKLYTRFAIRLLLLTLNLRCHFKFRLKEFPFKTA